MNPFLKWITAHRHAHAARDRTQGAEQSAERELRRCPNCHRSQPVAESLRAAAVRCEGCGVPIPPVPPGPPAPRWGRP